MSEKELTWNSHLKANMQDALREENEMLCQGNLALQAKIRDLEERMDADQKTCEEERQVLKQ
eukprot:9469388-Karenia_brevis.AAC.1